MAPPNRSKAPSLQQEFGGLYFFARDLAQSTLKEDGSPDGLIRLTGKLERLADREIARLHERLEGMGAAGLAIKPACAKGCWFCCTHVVVATAPEILSLADHIRSMWSPERIEELRKRISAHKAAMRRFREGATARPPRFACPLLVDGECSAWSSRPLVCRGWNSVRVDDCKAKMENPDQDVREHGFAPQVAVADFIRQGVSESLAGAGLSGDLCELAFGLEIALDDVEALDKYLRGEDVLEAARVGLTDWV